jgi:hypothetical protein
MSLEVSRPWTWCWLDRTVRLGAKEVADLELMLAGMTTTLLTIAVIPRNITRRRGPCRRKPRWPYDHYDRVPPDPLVLVVPS